ncbi:NACHT domain-containing protein [Streptomyces sp. NPDC006733]|uniref:NACHT domain-containing protein n=1 Tax=Streptomyces sp. NPDC006733 TaxID=3155460 RepID=UPI0033D90C66
MSADGSDQLAAAIIKAAFTVARQDPDGGTTATGPDFPDIAAAVLGKTAGPRVQRAAVRVLEDAADQLAERLDTVHAHRYGTLTDDDKSVVMDSIAHAVGSLPLSVEQLTRLELRGETVARQLRRAAVRRWADADLERDAQEYGALLVFEAAQFVVSLASQPALAQRTASTERAATTVEEISTALQDGISSVRPTDYRPDVSVEVSQFEAKYATDILREHGHMELFGIDVPESFRRQPVDIAYITLQSSAQDRWLPGREQVSSVDQAIVDAGKPLKRDPRVLPSAVLHPTPTTAGPFRVLVTGVAGSGKTTVSKWLAVCAARHSFPATLQDWQGVTPFVVQLRHLFTGADRSRLQLADLARVAAHRTRGIPEGWVDAQLRGGNALVVFDGMDELPPSPKPHRSEAYKWIDALMEEYPTVRFIVTSRPEGLDTAWFEQRGFRHLKLQPMRDQDIRMCVRQWFSCLLRSCPADLKSIYRQRRDRLLGHIAGNPSVRDLAETPLLCAMLCSFYASNLSVEVPKSRSHLYDQVINALISARDEQRRVLIGHGMELKDKKALLQAIARHLADHAQSTIRLRPITVLDARYATTWSQLQEFESQQGKTAHEILTDLLASFVSTRITIDDALEYVVERSAVLQQVGPNEVQFAHRTFQEFLAACDYADRGETQQLARFVGGGEDTWWRIIAFAAAKSTRRDASALLRRLVREAEQSPVRHRELLLLIAECVSTANVDPEVAETVRDALTEVLPPRTPDEATKLAGVGDHILNWLSGHQDPATVQACVIAAGHIGGPEAMALIKEYVAVLTQDGTTPAWLRAVVCAMWDRFDVEEYARHVLAQIDFEDDRVMIDTGRKLPALGHLRGARKLRIALDEAGGRVGAPSWNGLTELEELDCTGFRQLHSLDGIDRLTGLTMLGLRAGGLLTDYTPLARLTGLRYLEMLDCRHLHATDWLAALTDLETLLLSGPREATDWSGLARLTALRTLRLVGASTVPDLDFCQPLSGLRSLWVTPDDGVRDTTGIAGAQHLHRLGLTLARDRATPVTLPAPGAGRLRELSLTGHLHVDDLQSLRGHANLRSLQAENVVGLTSLLPLASFHHLRTLRLTDCRELRDIAGLSAYFPDLVTLDLSGAAITDLTPLADLPQLEEVYFERCSHLTHIDTLLHLPSLRHVSFEGMVDWLPLDVIAQLQDVQHVTVDYLHVGHGGA